MTRIAFDKILATMGAGLLGYALSLSLFRGLILNCLLISLPPINNRNLPDIYVGFFGALIAGILGYLLFIFYVEKLKFKNHGKTYFITLLLLFLLPLLTMFAFRIHAVSIVNKQESTSPTYVRISSDSQASSLMFSTGEYSASGIVKNIYLQKEDLDEFGRAVSGLVLEEVVDQEKIIGIERQVIWLNYQANGKWYSKNLHYNEGSFWESIAGSQIAYYSNPEFKDLMERINKASANIANYSKGIIVNTLTFNGDLETKEIVGREFEELIAMLKPANLLPEDAEVVRRIKEYSEYGSHVPQEELAIFGIELLTDDPNYNQSRNIMVYDDFTKTLMYEGQYYHVDLKLK